MTTRPRHFFWVRRVIGFRGVMWKFVFVGLFCFTVSARAEDREPAQRGRGFTVGPLLGVVFGFATGEPPREGTTRNALSFGVGMDVPISARYSFCPELHFVQRGANPDLFQVAGVNVAGTLRLNYFELPLLFKIKVSNERFRTYFLLGPALGIATNRDIQVLLTIDLSSRFRAFDLSFLLGYGMDYALGSVVVTAQLRLNSSILDLATQSNEIYRNAGIQLLTGVRF